MAPGGMPLKSAASQARAASCRSLRSLLLAGHTDPSTVPAFEKVSVRGSIPSISTGPPSASTVKLGG